jgi:hypothetical protein
VYSLLLMIVNHSIHVLVQVLVKNIVNHSIYLLSYFLKYAVLFYKIEIKIISHKLIKLAYQNKLYIN